MSQTNLTTNAKKKAGFNWLDNGPDSGALHKIIELIVFALCVPVIGFLFFRHDPVGMNAGFPWLILPPVIFAARYGGLWGFICALLAASSLLYPWAAYAVQASDLIALAVGTIILSILVGSESSGWKTQSAQASTENRYLRHRIKEFSKDYHVLKVSHGQLEEFMAGQRLSLRHALQQLKPALTTNESGLLAGSELMAVFAQFGAVQVAGLYGMKGNNRLDPQPVATHGSMPELSLFDPLVKLAIKSRQLVSVKLESHASETSETQLLAVVPIVDSHDYLHGILAIKDMHFMAFQQENLNVLSLLGSYIGDMLTRSRSVGESRSGWFLAELDNAIRFAKIDRVQSSLLCIQLNASDKAKLVSDFLGSNIRSLDSSWQPHTADASHTVVILLPLISETQCSAYLRRIADKLQEEHDINLQSVVTDIRTMQIRKNDTRDKCLTFINELTGFGESSKARKGLKFWRNRKRAA